MNQTPDEIAFAAELVPYYIKYQNAPLRLAEKWKDPTQFRMGALPKAKGGEGGTVFWDTGAALFKYGKNKEKAAEYLKALTYEPQIWKDSIAGSASGHPGQLPPYKSIYADWKKAPPDWLTAQTWVPLVRAALDYRQGHPEPSVRPHAVPDRPAHLGEVPEGRGDGSQEGDAGSQGRCRGRDQEVRLLRHLRDRLSYACRAACVLR